MTQKGQKKGRNNQGGRPKPTALDLLKRSAFKAALEVEIRVSAGERYSDAREETSQARGASTRTLERYKHDGQAFSAMGQPMATWQTLAHALPGETNPFWPSEANGKPPTTVPRALSPSMVTSADIQLLEHLEEILDEMGAPETFSADLAAALNAKVGAPWKTCGPSGKPMSATLLAHKLAKFRVKPTVIRIGDKRARGYSTANVRSAIKRHLPHSSANKCDELT